MEQNPERHQVVMLAGTGDHKSAKQIELATRHWQRKGLDVTVYNVGWRDGSTTLTTGPYENFEQKLAEIIKLVEELSKKGPVSLVGCSAGGSAAFNALLRREDMIQKAVSICGRLRAGKHRLRSLENLSGKTPPFRESVLLFEGQTAQIPAELRKRMMTVSAWLGDQLVPGDTSQLEGAYNIKIPTGEHNLSIGLALTLFSKPIIDFILAKSVE